MATGEARWGTEEGIGRVGQRVGRCRSADTSSGGMIGGKGGSQMEYDGSEKPVSEFGSCQS